MAHENGRTGLSVAVSLAIVAGILQSPIAAVAPWLPGREAYDDVLVLAALAITLPRLPRAPGLPAMLTICWIAAIFWGVTISFLPTADALVLARQLLMPAALVLIGTMLRPPEWLFIARVAIWVGIASAAYMLLELTGLRILDPAALSTFNSNEEQLYLGLPRYYFYWLPVEGTHFVRLGGLVLNPPIAGILTAVAALLLKSDVSFKGRKFWLVVLIVVTLLSISRAGWVILAIGLILVPLRRKVGAIGSTVLISPFIVFAAASISEHGNSGAHADGLFTGLVDALSQFWGVGFGHVGNYAVSLGTARASESLAGIAFSAAGLLPVAIVAALLCVLLRKVLAFESTVASAVGLGIITAALLSESAGAVNGTVPAWIACGFALSHVARSTVSPRQLTATFLQAKSASGAASKWMRGTNWYALRLRPRA